MLLDHTQTSSTTATEKVDSLEGDGLFMSDLTHRTRQMPIDAESVFTNDLSYKIFFTAMHRHLHRSSPRHVLLLRERGVGEQAALVELARAGVNGQPQFLHSKQFLTIDCRHVPFEAVRETIGSIFSKIGPIEQVIACLDGLTNLLRDRGFTDHRSILRSHLVRARCRIIGILSPHEYEEQIAIDPELNELFSIVRLDEPQPATACKLVRHYAAGMEVQYRVRISCEAVERAVALSGSYILHERLPYKAVKVLRSICDDLEYDRTQQGANRDCVTEADAGVLSVACGHWLWKLQAGLDRSRWSMARRFSPNSSSSTAFKMPRRFFRSSIG